ncbi:MAG: hypothetical protein AAB509_02825 [Patescibacteria group bacterium]
MKDLNPFVASLGEAWGKVFGSKIFTIIFIIVIIAILVALFFPPKNWPWFKKKQNPQ